MFHGLYLDCGVRQIGHHFSQRLQALCELFPLVCSYNVIELKVVVPVVHYCAVRQIK